MLKTISCLPQFSLLMGDVSIGRGGGGGGNVLHNYIAVIENAIMHT